MLKSVFWENKKKMFQNVLNFYPACRELKGDSNYLTAQSCSYLLKVQSAESA